MKTNKILIFALLLTQLAFSQRKSRADRFFEVRDYINAAKEYELELNREGYEKYLVENISTAYYNTYQFKKAYRYLKVLVSGKVYGKDKSYDNSYNFMMYHVLSALGDYERAIKFLALYKKKLDGTELSKIDAISIVEAFKLKDDDYKIKKADFNSEASEFGATQLDSVIYFTSDRKPNGFLEKNYVWTHRPFLNIYKKTKTSIESLSDKINTNLHEGNFCFSKDGNTMYVSKSYTVNGKKVFDSVRNNPIHLYKYNLVGGEWSDPEHLSFNSGSYSTEHPSLSADGKKLYFASNRPGGQGDFDIYYVDVNGDETYGKPINLGATINTENREQFPFISAENHLFFSSNGHLGLGMMDVFVSEFKEGGLTTPINLGAPINSRYDDFSFNYYNDEQGYFASNRKNKGDDIYSFGQIGEIFPREYIARFEVKDFKTDQNIPKASVVLYDDKNKVVYESQLDQNGSFERNIFPGKYEFKAAADAYKTKTIPIVVKEKDEEKYIIYLEQSLEKKTPETLETKKKKTTEEIASVPKDIEQDKAKLKENLLKDKKGPPVVERNGKLFFELPPIYFDYDKWEIRSDSKKVLDEFATKLEKYKTVYIKIGSHTDSRGSVDYNQLLSEKRAESTRNYLALIGYVNARRMQFKGYGESLPLINCEEKVCSEEEHQTNRRSEFEIVKY